MNLYNAYELTTKEKDLVEKVKKNQKLKYDDYIEIIKKFCIKYQNNDVLDKESNQIIYKIHCVFNLYYESNELARNTKYFRKYIDFNTR